MTIIQSRLEEFHPEHLHPGHTHKPPHSEYRLLPKLACDFLIALHPDTFIVGLTNHHHAFRPSLWDEVG